MNLILIGMPASGKSTAGRILAERLGIPFRDGDDLIRERAGKSLEALISERGAERFLALEEEVLCGIREERAVIATGGSAVYSARAMASLKRNGIAVLIRLSAEETERRIPDFAARGVVMRGKVKTLRALWEERAPLYERYADLRADGEGRTPAETAEEILRLLKTSKYSEEFFNGL